jgi:lipopolysaccharide transport protein LptA/LPS export ABC transporter protein LptC
MNRRRIVVYLSSAFIISIILLSGYFLFKKPERSASAVPQDAKKVIVFNDVKYSGEKKGVIDWEIRAKTARKYIDKPVIEMEGIEGAYRPRPDVTVLFKGKKGEIDTVEEKGTVENVEVFYQGQYTLRSPSMHFDFKKSLAWTSSPVDLKGQRLSLIGTGLIADTKEQTVKVQNDVQGTVETDNKKYKFSSDNFTYLLQEQTYIFDGRVVVKGEDMNLLCDRVYVKSQGDAIEKIEARGKVRLLSKGTIAKSELALYYLKEERVELREGRPKIVKDNVEMEGELIVYNMKTGKFSVERPKMRIEQR